MAYKDLPFKDSETLVVVDMVQNGTYLNGGNLEEEALHGMQWHSTQN